MSLHAPNKEDRHEVRLLMSSEREAHDVWQRRRGGWPEDSREVVVVDPGLPMHGPDVPKTAAVEGSAIVLADRPAVASDRAVGAYCLVEAADPRAVIDCVAAMPAVQAGPVVEFRPDLAALHNPSARQGR